MGFLNTCVENFRTHLVTVEGKKWEKAVVRDVYTLPTYWMTEITISISRHYINKTFPQNTYICMLGRLRR